MKKLLALILAVIMLVSFAGCGETEPEEPEMPNVVGIWQYTEPYNDVKYNKQYLYIYNDGTGDTYAIYASIDKDNGSHYDSFTWKIENDYFVKEYSFWGTTITKYTIDGDKMYDKQNKLAFTKISDDPTVDIEIKPD